MDTARTAPASLPAQIDAPPLRRNREYVTWLIGDLLLDAGTGIGQFAFPLMTLAVTGSAALTGLVGLVQGAGTLAGMIPGGLLADRCDRRRLRVIAGITGAVLQLALIGVLLLGAAVTPVLAALAFADRFRGSLLGVSNAMLKQIVPSAQLPRAFAVNEGREAAVELGAGPLGGALLAVHLAFPAAVQLAGSLGAAVSTLLLRGDYRPRATGAAPARVRDDLAEAWRWVLAQPIRLQLGASAALVNLGSNGLILTVTLSLALRDVPAARIGILSSVLAGSVLLGALLAPRIIERIPTGVVIVVEIALLAVAGIVLPFLDAIVPIATVYALMGLGLAPLNAGCQGFFMLITPTAMQGRIGALNGLLAMALMPLAPAVAGWGLQYLGRVGTMAIFAAVCAAAALIAVVGPHLRAVPVSGRWADYAESRGLAAP